MLKYLIFIIVITLFESCNDSRVQGGLFDFGSPKSPEHFHCLEGKSAEDTFIDEEYAKIRRIEDIKKEKRENADKLDVGKTASTRMPRKTWNPFKQISHFMGKFFQTIRDFKNIVKRDWVIKGRWKKAQKDMKKEALFDYELSGAEICVEAFKHKFFTHVKKWKLLPNHPETIANKKLWIRVQTPYYDIKAEYEIKEKLKAERRSNPEKRIEPEKKNKPKVAREKFWRYAKRCMAITDESDPNEPFKVYLSAAKGYGKRHMTWHPNTFVFRTTPRELRDWINNSVFWWHRVVHVEGYLW